jgi:hypothetical protein
MIVATFPKDKDRGSDYSSQAGGIGRQSSVVRKDRWRFTVLGGVLLFWVAFQAVGSHPSDNFITVQAKYKWHF